MCNIGARHIDRTCIVVMALCDQPEAFASDLSDNQSCYLFVNVHLCYSYVITMSVLLVTSMVLEIH